jgi:hypothetical protein
MRPQVDNRLTAPKQIFHHFSQQMLEHVEMGNEATESAPSMVNAAVNTDGVGLHLTTAVAE